MIPDEDIVELAIVIRSELIRAGLDELSPATLAAALRLLAADIELE